MNTPSICLSGVANEVPRTALSGALMPVQTETYQPIRHDYFLDLVEDKMAVYGFHFGEQMHALTREGGQRYFGMVQLLNGGSNQDFNLMLGLRNSYDKSTSAMLLLGAHVFICANMSYSAANVVGRKHTTHILRDLPNLIDKEVRKTRVYAEVQEQRFDAYQVKRISDTRADRLMIQMLRQGAIQTSKFSKLVTEWYEPQHDHGPKRAWRLFNACTEALKGTPVHDVPKRTLELQSIVDEEVGFQYAEAA